MAAALLNLFNLSFLLSLLSNPNSGTRLGGVDVFSATCKRIECPSYDVIYVGEGYEIRRYNSTVWMSTAPLQDISFVGATRNGFLQLFDYIQGKNSYEEEIEMTGPVITEVSPSDGPLCESTFVVSFYVPKVNQADPPPAKGLHAQRWGPVYVAVRQFGGYVMDSDVGEEAAALYASLSGTVWLDAIEKSHGSEVSTHYTVAQYNSPFEFKNRINEIWLTFHL